MSTIRPYQGKVYLTDSGAANDASDHNLLFAKLQIDAATKARFGTFNVKHSSNEVKGYEWSKRRAKAAALIAEADPSILTVQECEPEQAVYLVSKLKELTGDDWRAFRPFNVGILYKANKWELVAQRSANYDAEPGEVARHLALGLFRSKATGAYVWVGSTHLSVNFPLSYLWRRRQAAGIIASLKNIKRAPNEESVPDALYGDIRQHAVIMGDFNDYAGRASAGVRKVFDEGGFLEQRDRLSDAEFDGDSLRTNHGFGKATLRDARQIDAIFTPR
jgi:endonuclease/exonuclease/phosphatase family metal-dependent hydrolase